VRDLAAHAANPESSLLLDVAAIAEVGDLTAAARRLALAAAGLADFETREALSTLLPGLEAHAGEPPVPAQRLPSTMDSTRPLVRLRLGPGVPDAALANPRPPDAVPASARRWVQPMLHVLGWSALGMAVLTVLGALAWRLLAR
jgi:hypothetical protein